MYMSDKAQLIKLVRDFINYADNLLEKKQIDVDTYVNITKNKFDFLKKFENNQFQDTSRACTIDYNDNISIY
jgi:hypothetical protein